MKLFLKNIVLVVGLLLIATISFTQNNSKLSIENIFNHPPESAKPWVLWYWMHGAISKEGLTADLEAMKEAGIGGAYLVCIYDTTSKIPFDKPVRQLTPEWWDMVNHAMKESKRLGLKLAMHVSDGFALAGGPWIKPEQSMQKLVWTKKYIRANNTTNVILEQPETKENFYKDIAVFAYPANSENAFSDTVMVPSITTSTGEKAPYLAFPGDGLKTFKSDSNCWIQYKYPKLFTLRSLKTITGANNYQSQRLIIQSSDDGIKFKTVLRLQPSRHGWQDTDENYTFSIPATTARYFRFIYDMQGTEPGSEDLDGAKWTPSLKIKGIYLSDEPVINQIEAKNGSVWRLAGNTTPQMVSANDAIKFKNIINLTGKMNKDGKLNWNPTSGNWVIVRIGHTSTGHTNATGGAAKGLECDKFDADVIKLQFNNWFAKAFEKTDRGLAKEVLKIFYIDSWEAGSQNWSKKFSIEFKKRRGYDIIPYLLLMTGTPINDAATSEKILHDVRETIAELVNDVFYITLRKLADEKGCKFTAESVAPTMVSDGLLHYKTIDYPTGEFWLNSPTHDKPNDVFDAISAAHIYGKNIVQAEAFTTLRMNWSEHPGNLKVLGDRNFAMGINRMLLHVFTHNPWLDKKPGMTLNSIGLFYQRNQTWFNQSKAWIEYITRVSAILQQGKPVVDIAVFTGEEVPRRSILPDRLVNTLPGIFGKDRVESEKKRLANEGQPQRTMPEGVSHSANMADPENWTDALRGYKYDCFNPDALMQMTVKNGKVVLPNGAAYTLLVIPGKHPMQPTTRMSLTVAKKLLQLANNGANIVMAKENWQAFSNSNDKELKAILKELFSRKDKSAKIMAAPYYAETFAHFGLQRDVEIKGAPNTIAWTHRKTKEADIYFIANQSNKKISFAALFRVKDKSLKIYDPVTGKFFEDFELTTELKGINVVFDLDAGQSLLLTFSRTQKKDKVYPHIKAPNHIIKLSNNWNVKFDTAFGGPKEVVRFDKLHLWDENNNSKIKYYSGSAIYSNLFVINNMRHSTIVWLELDKVYNIASVKINGIDCGTIWTKPFRLEISKAVRAGENKIEIIVSNTWANRLIGDRQLPENERVTWTTAPFRLEGKPLLPAGLAEDVRILWKQ